MVMAVQPIDNAVKFIKEKKIGNPDRQNHSAVLQVKDLTGY